MQSVLKPLASGRLQRSVKLTSVGLHTFWIVTFELAVFSPSWVWLLGHLMQFIKQPLKPQMIYMCRRYWKSTELLCDINTVVVMWLKAGFDFETIYSMHVAVLAIDENTSYPPRALHDQTAAHPDTSIITRCLSFQTRLMFSDIWQESRKELLLLLLRIKTLSLRSWVTHRDGSKTQSLWRHSGHVLLNGNIRADPKHGERITYPIWPGSTSWYPW